MPVLAAGDEFDDFDDFDKTPDKKDKQEKKDTKVAKPPTKQVSKVKALVLSLILPGAGHYYIGEKGRAEVFAGAEVVAWTGFFAFRTYGNWKKDDYIRYAEDHAGIDPADKDDEFYKNLTFYENREDYNKAGRIINPGAPYYPTTPAYYWQWDNTGSQATYRTIRNASKTSFRKATFMLGMAALNRILASIDSYRLVRRVAGSKEEDEFSTREERIKLKFKGNLLGSNRSVGITLSRRF